MLHINDGNLVIPEINFTRIESFETAMIPIRLVLHPGYWCTGINCFQ